VITSVGRPEGSGDGGATVLATFITLENDPRAYLAALNVMKDKVDGAKGGGIIVFPLKPGNDAEAVSFDWGEI
jgi:hypothetical protein